MSDIPVTPRALSTPPHSLRKTHKQQHRPPFDSIALLLQGGGALGAYQAGVYEALAEADLHPDWVAGISIGGINSAIIAGNPREVRVAKLRQFWEIISHSPFGLDSYLGLLPKGEAARAFAQQMSERTSSVLGVPGFYTMRFPNPFGEDLDGGSLLEALQILKHAPRPEWQRRAGKRKRQSRASGRSRGASNLLVRGNLLAVFCSLPSYCPRLGPSNAGSASGSDDWRGARGKNANRYNRSHGGGPKDGEQGSEGARERGGTRQGCRSG